MKTVWVDKTDEGQTILEEILTEAKKIETTYEGTSLKEVVLKDKRSNEIARITAGTYGDCVKIWIPKEVADAADETT